MSESRGHGIDAVLLDAGHTLLFLDPERVLPVLRDLEGIDVGRAEFAEAERVARRGLTSSVEEGHRGTERHLWAEYFRTLLRECGVPEDRIEAVGGRLERLHAERHLWSRVGRGTVGALEALRNAGYRLAVISNADGRIERLLDDAGLGEHFEFVLDSGAVGVEKPDPRIFRMAVERLDLQPRRCLYVGDLHPVDVVGARAAGLRALLLDPFDLALGAASDAGAEAAPDAVSEAAPEAGSDAAPDVVSAAPDARPGNSRDAASGPVERIESLRELPAYLGVDAGRTAKRPAGDGAGSSGSDPGDAGNGVG